MDIITLIDRSNKMFELLEYSNVYEDYDELVSLKISLNNLLVKLDSEEPNFFEVLLLSSPVLFDFAFNSKLDVKGLEIRQTFERQKYYAQAKKWYKFIRNSLIHTNRYTYNNFLKSIYRIEYNQNAIIYFELEPEKEYRFREFMENQFFILNEEANVLAEESTVYVTDDNVRIDINFEYFNYFILDIVEKFIRSIEHDVDRILANEVNKWNYYYQLYTSMIENVYSDNHFDLKLLKRLVKSISNIKHFDLEEAYILCEFLVYLSNLDIEFDERQVSDITKITTFDKYYQIEDRQLILNRISQVKDYERVYIDYDQVAWVLNEVYPLSSENDQSLQILEHTNYLIMYVQKYLKAGEKIGE